MLKEQHILRNIYSADMNKSKAGIDKQFIIQLC